MSSGSGIFLFKYCQCIFRYFGIISPWKMVFTNLNSHHPWMFCVKFGCNWPSGSGEEDFKTSQVYFLYFVITSPWKRSRPFIWTNFNSLHPRMLCAKLGWNLPISSGEEHLLISSVYFRYLVIISLWKKAWPFI